MLADAGYLNATVVDATASRGAELIAPEGRTPKDEKNWDAKRKQLSKNEFKYDPQADTYTCPAGRTLKNIGRFKRDGKKPPYSQYRCKNCESCPFSERCLAVIKGKRSTARTIKRYESDAAKQEIRTKLMSEERRRLYRQRQTTVEPVHGEIKMLQAGRRFRRRGLKSVRLEYTLHAMSHNLRRFCILQARTNG